MTPRSAKLLRPSYVLGFALAGCSGSGEGRANGSGDAGVACSKGTGVFTPPLDAGTALREIRSPLPSAGEG